MPRIVSIPTVKVSVIITAYDRKKFILNAINSVIHQTLSRLNYEVIVVKNFLDLEIDSIIEENAIVSVFSDEKFQGKMLYDGIVNSSGDIISLLDDDDIFLPNKLEYILNKFLSNVELVYLHNGFVECTSDKLTSLDSLNDCISNYNPRALKRDYMILNGGSGARATSKFRQNGGDFNSSCTSFRREILVDEFEILKKVQHSVDSFIFCASAVSGKVLTMDKTPLTVYRITESNSTNFTVSRLLGLNQGISQNMENDGIVQLRRKMTVYLKELLEDLNLLKSSILIRAPKLRNLLDVQISSVSLTLFFTRDLNYSTTHPIRSIFRIGTQYLLSVIRPTNISIKNLQNAFSNFHIFIRILSLKTKRH